MRVKHTGPEMAKGIWDPRNVGSADFHALHETTSTSIFQNVSNRDTPVFTLSFCLYFPPPSALLADLRSLFYPQDLFLSLENHGTRRAE